MVRETYAYGLPSLEENPFSIRPLEPGESGKLIGRDDLFTRLQNFLRFRSARRVMLLGPLGSGRTSLVSCLKTYAAAVATIDHLPAHSPAASLLSMCYRQMIGGEPPVNRTELVTELVNEMYFAILLDRASAGPMVIACSEGGTSIEDLAESHPEKIIKMKIDLKAGLTEAQALELARGLNVSGDAKDAAKQLRALYEVFVQSDCTMLEVNPLAETDKKLLVAADAKLNFDDNAEYRQKALFALRDHSQEDPREVAAGAHDLNYIGLDGNIGCMVNGAGLAMATMDIISLHGASPANFLDVGGNASEQQVVEAFKILTADKKVKALLVNIFGGIMKCDVIASGIVNAAKQVGIQVPLIVRLEGTNVEAGKEILSASGMDIIAADDLDDAAKKAVAALA